MRKIFLLAIPLLIGAIFAMAFVKNSSEKQKNPVLRTDDRGKPLALSKHLERLHKTLPDNGGESDRGPGGPAEEKLFRLAFPDTDIPIARLEAAASSFETIKNKGFKGGKGQPGTWISVGPSNAAVPFFDARNTTVYTPNKYAAGGRTTCMAIAPTCNQQSCRIWIGAAGGGVWRTNKALAGTPSWTYLSGSFGLNSVGSIILDPNDSTGNTIYVGTGEANASADSVHGVGIYKSTDGGDTWDGPLGESTFKGRAVGTIAIKPGDANTIYAGTTRAVNGMSSVIGGAITTVIPGAPVWGLYKSTDGGATWNLIHNGAATTAGCLDPATVATNGTPCSPRGVRNVKIDPVDANVVYASSYARGIWRSSDNGTSWTQIKASLNAALNITRAEIALTVLANGATRMYVGEGHNNTGGQYSRFFRSDSVRTGAPIFTDLTSNSPANPGYGSFNYCTGQCWYDNLVYTPPGHPDIVYLGGANQYNENDPFPPGIGWVSNGRGVVLSQDAGVSWTDLTYDATDFLHPNGLHPDHHAIVTNPNNPFHFFEGSDGGIARSSGQLTDISAQCSLRGITVPAELARCQQLLSAVPTELESISKGLATLQFQSVSVSPFKSDNIQGGTQDNGTWETNGNPTKWDNTMIGDGGQSGFDVGDKTLRFHSFFNSQFDVNFSSGDVADWNWTSDPFFIFGEFGLESFYPPIIHDPVVSKTMFSGALHVFRTKTYGTGSMSEAEFREQCNEWFGSFSVICGDWTPLGDPTAAGQLGSTTYGADRIGVPGANFVAAVERAPSDYSTLWAATAPGRVFVSKNADADPASTVTFTRIDTLSLNDPGRFVSGIFVDPTNPNHAWICYTGFSVATPATPGHVFSVEYDPVAGTATWANLDGSGPGALGDIPISDIVFDRNTGDLYVSNDYGVLREAAGGGINWIMAAPGLPNVEVPGLTIVAADRKLYAATHGLSVWRLNLP